MTGSKKLKAKHGGHNPDNVLLGIHVTPEQKAIAQLTANKIGNDVSTVMLNGLWAQSSRLGITDLTGNVTPEYESQIKAAAQRVREKKIERQKYGN